MELLISGLKCDCCTYRNDSIQFSEYHMYVDKPCPECGTNLLTQEDYNKCLQQYKMVNKINQINHKLRWLNPFFYLRLVFGDNRKISTLDVRYETNKKGKHIVKTNIHHD